MKDERGPLLQVGENKSLWTKAFEKPDYLIFFFLSPNVGCVLGALGPCSSPSKPGAREKAGSVEKDRGEGKTGYFLPLSGP